MAEVIFPIIMKKGLKGKLDWLSTEYKNEIGGWITGKIAQDNIVLDDLLIPYQEVGGAHINMTGKQIAKLRKEYGKECEKIIAEWHSHNSMGSFWSSVDEHLIKQLMGPRNIFLFIVSSKGDHKIRLEMRKPFHISVDNMEYETEIDNKAEKGLKKEIKKKVTEIKFSYSGYGLQSNFDIMPAEKIESQEDRLNADKEIKEKIKRMMKYDDSDKSITISGIPWYYADGLMNEFQDYSPEMSDKGEYFYIIKFAPKNKMASIELMKELREWLRMVVNEEMEANLLDI